MKSVGIGLANKRLKTKTIPWLGVCIVVGICFVGCRNPNPQSEGRPRTISEALKQERQTHSASVSGLPEFQTYDREFISSVEERWYDLLDARGFAPKKAGKVVVKFKLYSSGSVSDLETVENSMDEKFGILCVKAISDLAPFPKWPDEMRAMVGDDQRKLQFTFYYNAPNPKNQRKR